MLNTHGFHGLRTGQLFLLCCTGITNHITDRALPVANLLRSQGTEPESTLIVLRWQIEPINRV
jgi:hypothetical protein